MAAKLTKTGSPGIYRRHAKDCAGGRCDCAYVVVWRHRGKQHTETYRTLAEAREAKGNRDAGERRPDTRVSLGDYFAEWIETYAGRTARGFSETTRPEYRRPIVAEALPKWSSWRLADVEPADVRELFGSMRKTGKSTAAIKKLRAALSAMFATAVEDGLIRSNPVQGVRVPSAPEPEPGEDRAKALTRAELAILLTALPAEWRLFHEFLAHTGLRIGEAIGLTWAHVELGKRPRLLIREQIYRGERRKLKSRQGRRDVPLSPGMAGKLAELRRDAYRDAAAPVFASRVGTPLDPSRVAGRVLKPAARDAGLVRARADGEIVPWVSFHTFRHTCASLLFDAGRNVRQVSEWLGHADPAFTLRTYVHLLDEGVGDAAFLDETVAANPARVNTGSTRCPKKAANREAAKTAKTGLFAGVSTEQPQPSETPESDS